VIVGSASYISDDPHPPLHEIYRNNESVSPNPRNPVNTLNFIKKLPLLVLSSDMQTSDIILTNLDHI